MAKEEEKEQSVPTLVDYGGSVDAEDEHFTARNVEAYFKKIVVTTHRSGGVLFNLKDRSLFKRLLEEFEVADVKAMIVQWVETHSLKEAINVGYFYKSRYDIFENEKEKDYSDWLQ